MKMIFQEKLDFQKLLALSKEQDMVNIVGCFLDVVNNIRNFTSAETIRMFKENMTKKKRVFLPEEKQFGKSGWETSYEEKWNIDLYLDLGAIKHGVRSA